MRKKPEVTDSEILQYMDFDGLLRQHANATQANQKKSLIKKSLLWVGGITLVGLLLFTISENTTQQTTPTEQVSPELPDTPEPTQHEVTAATEEQAEEKQPVVQQLDNKPTTPLSTNKQSEKQSEVEQKETEQSEYIYHQASPVDGYGSLYTYFNTALQYPPEAIADSVQGVVTISFIINKSGEPEKITIENSPDERLNQEAIRLIQNMPAWNPATLNG